MPIVNKKGLSYTARSKLWQMQQQRDALANCECPDCEFGCGMDESLIGARCILTTMEMLIVLVRMV